MPLTYRGAILLTSADLPAVNFADLKDIQHIVAVPNVSYIFREVLVKKVIILVLTESCGPHVKIKVIVFMLKLFGKLPHKTGKTN